MKLDLSVYTKEGVNLLLPSPVQEMMDPITRTTRRRKTERSEEMVSGRR